MANKKPHRPGELDALYFEKLPQRCKEIFFEFLSCEYDFDGDKAFFVDVGELYCEDCQSPIEQIFKLAYEITCFTKLKSSANILSIYPQAEIIANGHKYYADFLFDTDECTFKNPEGIKPYKLVIECDGHEFHEKTKAQVKKANERDMDLKLADFDVLHFSGSQIYNEPFKCAEQTIAYILSKISKAGEVN